MGLFAKEAQSLESSAFDDNTRNLVNHTSTTAGKEFQNKGRAIRANKTEEEKAKEGVKSSEVKFITCLANPAKKQSRQDSHLKTDIPCYEVVGYKFELLGDARVPHIPYKEGAKSFDDVEKSITWEDHKAGEIIQLNIMETGMFIGQDCYAGQISGEGNVVNLIIKKSKSRKTPRPCLRREGGAGSIKTSMEFVAELVTQPDSKRPVAVCKEEYVDTFGNLFTNTKKKTAKGNLGEDKEAHKDNAAAFTAYFMSTMVNNDETPAEVESED